MTIKRCGLYDNTGSVVNVIQIDESSNYQPPQGLKIIDDEMVEIGYTVVDGVLIVPEPENIEETGTDTGAVEDAGRTI